MRKMASEEQSVAFQQVVALSASPRFVKAFWREKTPHIIVDMIDQARDAGVEQWVMLGINSFMNLVGLVDIVVKEEFFESSKFVTVIISLLKDKSWDSILPDIMRCIGYCLSEEHEIPPADSFRLFRAADVLADAFSKAFRSEKLMDLDAAVAAFHALHKYLQLSGPNSPRTEFTMEKRLVKSGIIQQVISFASSTKNQFSFDYAMRILSHFGWVYHALIVKGGGHNLAIKHLANREANSAPSYLIGVSIICYRDLIFTRQLDC
jgi:hypothetical protein